MRSSSSSWFSNSKLLSRRTQQCSRTLMNWWTSSAVYQGSTDPAQLSGKSPKRRNRLSALKFTESVAIALAIWLAYPVQVQATESLQTKESHPLMKRRESKKEERFSLVKVFSWITFSLLLKVVTLRRLKKLLLRNILLLSKQWCKAKSKSSTKCLQKKKKAKVKTSCRTGYVIIAQARAKFRGTKISLMMSMKSKMVKKTTLLRF